MRAVHVHQAKRSAVRTAKQNDRPSRPARRIYRNLSVGRGINLETLRRIPCIARRSRRAKGLAGRPREAFLLRFYDNLGGRGKLSFNSGYRAPLIGLMPSGQGRRPAGSCGCPHTTSELRCRQPVARSHATLLSRPQFRRRASRAVYRLCATATAILQELSRASQPRPEPPSRVRTRAARRRSWVATRPMRARCAWAAR